jgi:hypothetical protein
MPSFPSVSDHTHIGPTIYVDGTYTCNADHAHCEVLLTGLREPQTYTVPSGRGQLILDTETYINSTLAERAPLDGRLAPPGTSAQEFRDELWMKIAEAFATRYPTSQYDFRVRVLDERQSLYGA